jgi:acetyl-CoA acetyltransferase
VLTTQLDPYYLAPLGPDAVSIAALQAQALLDTGRYTELDFARVAAQNRRRGQDNPMAQVTGDFDVDSLMAEMPIVTPLRKHDCPPISDGAAAVILAAGDTARKHVERPAWIRGIDHRMEPHNFAARDWTRSPSTALAASKVGLTKGEEVDVVELHAPFSHQECILLDALGLEGDPLINPSGGALCANPVMAAGLIRMGEAAAAIHRGDARRALAHATSGPALQQNMVCLMEGE